MPTIPPKFNWGDEVKNINSELYNQLNDNYSLVARITNTKISKLVTTTDPITDGQINLNFDVGDVWVNTSTDMAWIMSSRATNTSVTWKLIT